MDDNETESSLKELIYQRDLATLTPEEQALAIARLKEVRVLVDSDKPTEQEKIDAAKRLGISRSWLYVLIARYHPSSGLSSMLGDKRGVKQGTSRIEPAVDKIVWDVINELYLTLDKKKPFFIIREIGARCFEHGLKPPAKNTIRKRIKSIPARKATAAREGGHVARDKFSSVFEGFPIPKFPLGVVQMDHTPVDILIVNKERLSLGRALYLTVAIDVFSRAIVGFHLSLQAPSSLSVALCLNMMAQPKTNWLRHRKLDLNWSMWGKPDLLHVDNGSDFRSNGLSLGCYENGIILEHRPVKHPSTGGIVERLIGTLMTEVHQYPGTTYSNVGAKGKTDPEKRACLTMEEVEQLLAICIAEQYHEEVHSGINRRPRAAWDAGIFGEGNKVGRGLPKRIPIMRKFLLDFLPVKLKGIQRYGFQWDYIRYNDDRLRILVGRGDKTKYVIRRDPRDLSKIYMLYTENDANEYWEIACANISRERLTLDEHKAALKYLHDRNQAEINEELIFNAHRKIQAIIRNAEKETRSARRSRAKTKQAKISVERVPSSKPEPVLDTVLPEKKVRSKSKILDDGFDDLDLRT